MRVDRAVRDLSITPPALARREHTRLWYRMDPRDRAAQLREDKEQSAPETRKRQRESTGSLRALDAIQAALNQVEHKAETKRSKKESSKSLTDWRDAPRHCPVVLLSATAALDKRVPGPILGPGTRYRILSQDDGVVEVQVESLDGQVAVGHCKSMDLLSYEPEIMYLREDKRGRRGTSRLGIGAIQRIAGSIIG